MNLKLIKEVEAPLLSRKRCTFEIEFPKQKTPSNEEIKKLISSSMEISPELISIKHIYQRFRINKAKVIANLYKDAAKLKDIEEIKKKKVKKPANAEAKTEAKAEVKTG